MSAGSTAPSAAPKEDAVALLLASARLLLVNGQTTERTVGSVMRLARCLGLSATVFPGWGETVLRIEGAGAPRIEVIAAPPAGVEMHKVTLTLQALEAVCGGSLSPADALRELERVAHLPPVSLPRFALLAAAGAAALAVIFGASDFASLGVIAASAGVGACLRRGLSHISSNFLPQPLAAALLAGLVAAVAAPFLPPSAIFLVALCPCMVLVPGPHLLNGALDLAHMRIALGAVRFGYAGVIILLISVGLVAGLSLGRQSLPLSAPAAAVPLGFDVIAAGVAVAAYGTFFSMPWRTLPFPILVGMAAHALHWAAVAAGADLSLAALVACLFVGTVATPVTDRLCLPFAAVAFASVVSLIPGSFLFRMTADLFALMQAGETADPALLMAAIVDGTIASAVMIAMAFGLILPKMLIEEIFPPSRR